ncbi:MAG: addiction module antitoxin [Thermoanaerobaculia bacterium]|nr:addiction module antitoxin [Thermoanaerobaculia bacterium]
MRRRLTISVDSQVYEGLYRHVGARQVSRFIETLVRPHVVPEDLRLAYAQMAEEEDREVKAEEWSEAPMKRGEV